MKNLIMTTALLCAISGCVSTVKPGEVGLRWQPWGSGLQKDPLRPEVYVYAPWNDIYTYKVQWNSFSEQVEILTKDDLKVLVVSTVIVRPNPGEIYQLQQAADDKIYLAEGGRKPQYEDDDSSGRQKRAADDR